MLIPRITHTWRLSFHHLAERWRVLPLFLLAAFSPVFSDWRVSCPCTAVGNGSISLYQLFFLCLFTKACWFSIGVIGIYQFYRMRSSTGIRNLPRRTVPGQILVQRQRNHGSSELPDQAAKSPLHERMGPITPAPSTSLNARCPLPMLAC
ncbi:hypothetical protein BDW74DRAFT_158347 [Aspergillus multicolor]|uniref:uncharacterized protein n=1 Tax=Aspergillus multicolor TaxID=41759 RepID=UPI003CCE23E2